MFPRRHADFKKRNNPFLLLWLLPYLFSGLAADGLHSHDFGRDNKSSGAGCFKAAASLQTSTSLRAAAGGECLACQWSAQSVAHLAPAPEALTLKSQPFDAVPNLASHRPPSLADGHNRGPPLS